jgi:ATP-dependent Zn protease
MKAGTQLDAAEHLKGMAYHEAGHAVVAYLLVERTYSLSRPPSAPLRQR